MTRYSNFGWHYIFVFISQVEFDARSISMVFFTFEPLMWPLPLCVSQAFLQVCDTLHLPIVSSTWFSPSFALNLMLKYVLNYNSFDSLTRIHVVNFEENAHNIPWFSLFAIVLVSMLLLPWNAMWICEIVKESSPCQRWNCCEHQICDVPHYMNFEACRHSTMLWLLKLEYVLCQRLHTSKLWALKACGWCEC
jgi:hypothetical protein